MAIDSSIKRFSMLNLSGPPVWGHLPPANGSIDKIERGQFLRIYTERSADLTALDGLDKKKKLISSYT